MSQIAQHDIPAAPAAGHPYLAKSLGAPFRVYLTNGVEVEVDPPSGKAMTSIIDLPGLIGAVVRSRVSHPRKLSGADLKFIRSALRLQSKVIAAVLDTTPEHYSRCEHGQKTMSTTTEKLYRGYAYVFSFLNDRGFVDEVRTEKNKESSPEEAQNALLAVQRLFSSLKIKPVFSADEELCFTFSRRCPDATVPCGDDDAKWKSEQEPRAA
jgi:hypothetical protein